MVLILQSEGNGNGLAKFPVPNSVARLSYFFGQLLSQRDFQAEQTYNLVLRRLVQREAFGTGTVAGLEVAKDKDGETLPLGVFIAPGLAFDPDGRELLLEKDVAIDVADPPLQPENNPFDSESEVSLSEQIADRWEHPFDDVDLAELGAALLGCGLIFEISDSAIEQQLEKLPVTPPDLTPPELLRDWLFDQLIGVTFVGLRYRETGEEPAPAVLDASCCGDTTCRPSRTQEGVFIVTSRERFPEIADPYQDFKLCLDENVFGQIDTEADPEQVDCKAAMCRCVLAAWRGVPKFNDSCGASDPPIVCLAQVCWDRYSNEGDTQILNVDNCECRQLAPGGPALRAFIETLTGCATPQLLAPRLVEIDPEESKEFEADDTTGTITLKATANANLTPIFGSDKVWEIRYYAESGSTVGVFSASIGPPGSAGPQGRNVGVNFNGHDIEIVIDPLDPPVPLDPGTYVWRLTNDSSDFSTIEESETSQELDGEPNPPKDVPSGDGIAGGGFEARFVVKNGGGGE